MTETSEFYHRCPFCNGRLGDDPRRTCLTCKMSDRQRSLRNLYEAMRPMLSNLHCLNLTNDGVVKDQRYFTKITPSIYGGTNHIDLQDIKFPDNSFDFSVCNHVFEHIPDDRRAIRELIRVTSTAAQITVPVTTKVYSGEEYGSANPTLHGHWRHYGADFGSRVKEIATDCHVLVTVLSDTYSSNYDVSYLVVKNLEFGKRVFSALLKQKIPCVVVS